MSAKMFRFIVAAIAAGTIASTAAAENLHQKYGPSWDCGYISYGLPYKEACEACEAEGKEFNQVGNGGHCVAKPGIEDRRSLRDAMQQHHYETPAEPEVEGRDSDESLSVPPDTPAYGTSGISTREGGSFHSDDTVEPASDQTEKALRLAALTQLKDGLEEMKAGRWDQSVETLDNAGSGSSHQTSQHVRWLRTIATNERRLTHVENGLHALQTHGTISEEAIEEMQSQWTSTQISRLYQPVEREVFTGGNEELSRVFNLAERRAEQVWQQSTAFDASILLKDDSSRAAEGLSKCLEAGGVVVDDILKGAETKPRKFCAVKPIGRDEVYELIREYELAMQ